MKRKAKPSAPTPLDAMSYWQTKHGHRPTPELLAMLERAGTTYDYWKHICNLRKRPGADLARRLVKESSGELCFDKLLFPRELLRGGKSAQGVAA